MLIRAKGRYYCYDNLDDTGILPRQVQASVLLVHPRRNYWCSMHGVCGQDASGGFSILADWGVRDLGLGQKPVATGSGWSSLR